MDFKFEIPANSLELLNSDGNKYFVKQIHDVNELPGRLKGKKRMRALLRFFFWFLNSYLFVCLAARDSITASDATFIFDHFDTFFSLIENARSSQMSFVSMTRGVDLLYLSIDKEARELLEFFQRTSVDAIEREVHLNLTKMLIYLMVGMVRAIDRMLAETGTPDVGGKRAAKRGVSGDSANLDLLKWDEQRFKSLVQLMNFCQMPLEKLWSLCMAEESFVE